MYLRKLYMQHKGWFIVAIFFIAAQLFINYKKGVVFSPFFHYGMYSAKSEPQEEYNVTEIYVNGNLLQTKDFSPQQWDNITLPVTMFAAQKDWNSLLWRQDISRMLHLTDSSRYINSITQHEFDRWYHIYLSKKLGFAIGPVIIKQQVYQYNKPNLSKSVK